MLADYTLRPLQAGLAGLRLRVLRVAESDRVEHWLGSSAASAALLAKLPELDGFYADGLDLTRGLLVLRAPALAISLPALARCWRDQGGDASRVRDAIAQFGAGCCRGGLALTPSWYSRPLPGVRRARFIDLACLAFQASRCPKALLHATADATTGLLRVAVGDGHEFNARGSPSNVWCVELGQLASDVREAGAASPFTPTEIVLKDCLGRMLEADLVPGAMWIRSPSADERSRVADALAAR